MIDDLHLNISLVIGSNSMGNNSMIKFNLGYMLKKVVNHSLGLPGCCLVSILLRVDRLELIL